MFNPRQFDINDYVALEEEHESSWGPVTELSSRLGQSDTPQGDTLGKYNIPAIHVQYEDSQGEAEGPLDAHQFSSEPERTLVGIPSDGTGSNSLSLSDQTLASYSAGDNTESSLGVDLVWTNSFDSFDTLSIGGTTPVGTPVPFPSLHSTSMSPLTLSPQEHEPPAESAEEDNFIYLDNLGSALQGDTRSLSNPGLQYSQSTGLAPALGFRDMFERSSDQDFATSYSACSEPAPAPAPRERAYSDIPGRGGVYVDMYTPNSENTDLLGPSGFELGKETSYDSQTVSKLADGFGTSSVSLQVPGSNPGQMTYLDTQYTPSVRVSRSPSPRAPPSRNASRDSGPYPTSPVPSVAGDGGITKETATRGRLRASSNPSTPSATVREISSSVSPSRRRSQKHPSVFACEKCDKKFTRVYNLRSHMRSHTDERPFACTVCGRAFARQHDRRRHEELHSGEKKFVCEGVLGDHNTSWGCGRKFARADALGRHFRTEAGKGCIRTLVETIYTGKGSTEPLAEGIMYKGDVNNEPDLVLMEEAGSSTGRKAVLLSAISEQIKAMENGR